jgi:hypothetical protein
MRARISSGSDLIRSHSLNGTAAVNGSLTAEIGGIDPYFFLLFPGLPSAINLNTGDQRPIDTSKYTRASFRFCTDVHHLFQQARLYWYDGYTDGNAYPSQIILLDSGCKLYTRDLSNQTGWQGDITGLRFDLDYLETGDRFSIDWFRLTEAPDWSNSYQIWWTELGPSGKPLQLFLDPDASGYDGHMHRDQSSASYSFRKPQLYDRTGLCHEPRQSMGHGQQWH